MQSRRSFLASTLSAPAVLAQPARKPNVVVIITDDQGYGDLSIHGNPHLKTPNMDRIGHEGVEFTQFHVCPVCAPTRASLMTGRYNYRTGVVDTYLGRAMMFSDEVTLAEMLGLAGYRTGIFGKWHLGDNYPLRPKDQGFQESLVHTGGGLEQPSGPPGNHYFDPVLLHNGKARNFKGYCTDIFTDAALRFIEQNRARPFFAYIPTNAPHTPLHVADSYVAPFRGKGLDETTARIYGMLTNLDENVGRILAKLKELDLERDTIVIFLTDNGPQQKRYNAGMRGLKGSVYEGGIRVPCFIRWPGVLKAGTKVDRLAAHIDLTPTLLDACGVPKPRGVRFDGVSLMPLLGNPRAEWPDRTLFFQWHRGDEPQAFRACAARNQRWKLVDGKELYDLETDPGETKDVAAAHPEIVARLRREYEAWFKDVSATRGYAPPRIFIGTDEENPVLLTRQDWRGPRASWDATGLGHWEVDVKRGGAYEVKLLLPKKEEERKAAFTFDGKVLLEFAIPAGADSTTVKLNRLPTGKGRIEVAVREGGSTIGPHFVELRRL